MYCLESSVWTLHKWWFGNSRGSKLVAKDVDNVSNFIYMRCNSTIDCWNGLETNRDLGSNDGMNATVHNSIHDASSGFNNHDTPLQEALDAGHRGLPI